MKDKWDKTELLVFFPIMILIGKIIRWTILKSVLVDMSIGNGMISNIVEGNVFFSILSNSGGANPTGNSVFLFSIINIFKLTTTIEFEVYISIIWNFLLVYLLIKTKDEFTDMQFFFLNVSVIVLNIWCFCLSKEPVQMLFFLFISLILINKKLNSKSKYILSILIILLAVLFYRTYYILIIFFFILTYLVCEYFLFKLERINKKTIILLLVILAFTYFIMLNILSIIDIESYNELIYVRTRSGIANTQMINIFKSTNLLLFSLDYFIMIIRMMFPIELLPLGIKYFPYVLYQLLVSYFLIDSFSNIKKTSKSRKIAIYMFIAFLLASATFEPDFGSWIRHEASTFPIFLIICGALESKDKGEICNENIVDKNYKKTYSSI